MYVRHRVSSFQSVSLLRRQYTPGMGQHGAVDRLSAPVDGERLSAVFAAGNVNIVMLRHPVALLLQAANTLPDFIGNYILVYTNRIRVRRGQTAIIPFAKIEP